MADLNFLSHNFDPTNEEVFHETTSTRRFCIDTTFNNIVKNFGKPIQINDGKTKYVWYVKLLELDLVICIYDWKETTINKTKEISWEVAFGETNYVDVIPTLLVGQLK